MDYSYWAALSLSFRLNNIKAWGPQVMGNALLYNKSSFACSRAQLHGLYAKVLYRQTSILTLLLNHSPLACSSAQKNKRVTQYA